MGPSEAMSRRYTPLSGFGVGAGDEKPGQLFCAAERIPNMSLTGASDLPNQRGTSDPRRPLAETGSDLLLPHWGGK